MVVCGGIPARAGLGVPASGSPRGRRGPTHAGLLQTRSRDGEPRAQDALPDRGRARWPPVPLCLRPARLADRRTPTCLEGRNLAGAATGVVDAERQLGAHRIKAGDVIIGMPASGFHANGFSLVRHIIKTAKLSLEAHVSEYGKTSGEVFLTPTEIYTLDCLALIKSMPEHLHAFSHITGGGIAENTARVIPAHLTATYDRSTWALPVEMEFMAQMGGVPQADMERTWNCGIGMSAFVDPSVADLTLRSLAARGMKAWVAGVVTERKGSDPRSTLEGSYQAR